MKYYRHTIRVKISYTDDGTKFSLKRLDKFWSFN